MDKKIKLQSMKKIITLGVFASGVIIVFLLLGTMFSWYDTTKVWPKKEEAQLALLDPSMLYLNDGDKENLSKYINARTKVWDETKMDFVDNISSANIDELNKLYEPIKGLDFPELHSEHEVINKAWEVQQLTESLDKLDNLTLDFTTKVKELFTTQFQTLNELSLTQKATGFVERTYDKFIEFAKTNDVLEQVYKTISSAFYYDGSTHTLYVRSTTTDNAEVEFKKASEVLANNQVVKQLQKLFSTAREAINNNAQVAKIKEQMESDAKVKKEFEEFQKKTKEEQEKEQALVIEYPNFVGKTKAELEKWAKDNNIQLSILVQESSKPANEVLEQQPNNQLYKKITKGSSISVVVSENQTTTSTSTTTRNQSSSSTARTIPSESTTTTERRQ